MSPVLNFILAIPLAVRLALLALLGALIGRWINRGIYTLAHWPRGIGPWGVPIAGSTPRRWVDHLPLLGWISLRRDSSIHGAGYWVRPLLIELSVIVGLPLLYWWETQGGLLPKLLAAPIQPIAHAQFVGHAVLIGLMIVATFIDFDEQTIPDEVTLPGVLFGLIWVAAAPKALMVSAISKSSLELSPGPLWITVPNTPWPNLLDSTFGLVIGLFCLGGACLAVYPAVWTTRRGRSKAFQFFAASVVRQFTRGRRRFAARAICFVWLAGSLGIVWIWLNSSSRWPALLSSLVGMAAGGALVWGVRIVGTSALGREAMGFGDVTLMAMIGALLGWQGSLMVFFLAPFAALLIAVAQYIFTRRTDIAFGPYLCFSAVVLIVGWNPIWNGRPVELFTLGWLIPGLVVVSLAMMGGILWGWQGLKDRLDEKKE